jgi:hypothetical protein
MLILEELDSTWILAKKETSKMGGYVGIIWKKKTQSRSGRMDGISIVKKLKKRWLGRNNWAMKSGKSKDCN